MLDAFKERKNNEMVENEGGEKSNEMSGNIKGYSVEPSQSVQRKFSA